MEEPPPRRQGVRRPGLVVKPAQRNESPEARIRRLEAGLTAAGLLEDVELVAGRYHVTPRDILGRRRTMTVSAARHDCWHVIRSRYTKSLPEIGELFGVDHTSVLHGILRAQERAATSLEEVRHVDA